MTPTSDLRPPTLSWMTTVRFDRASVRHTSGDVSDARLPGSRCRSTDRQTAIAKLDVQAKVFGMNYDNVWNLLSPAEGRFS